MNVFVTCINGMRGAAITAQRKVAKVAKTMGFDVMGCYRIPEDTDDDNELNHRMDGIISSLKGGDVVIMQFPTWNGLRYENSLACHVKGYSNVKLIIFVQDVEPLQFDPERTTLPIVIKLFNKADGLILPSRRMYQELKDAGLTVPESRIVYQTIWDYPTDLELTSHHFIKRFLFTGEPTRFPFLADYHGTTPIHLFSFRKLEGLTDQNIEWKGYLSETDLMVENARGGFGLVWSDEAYYKQYYCMNQPYKLGSFLAAGLPVVIRKGSHQQEFIEKNHLGIAVDSLEEADAILQNMKAEEYRTYLEAGGRIQSLSVNGFYTRKVLNDAVIAVCESSDDKAGNRVLGR